VEQTLILPTWSHGATSEARFPLAAAGTAPKLGRIDMLETAIRPSAFSASRWERIVVAALLTAFVIVGINSIGNDAFEGQGLNWYLPLVLTLPFIEHVYQWGYWLPRLVLPGLWCFGLCLFAWLDEFTAKRSAWVGIATIIVGIQAFLQVASVWY
jgi:hypothetical protein